MMEIELIHAAAHLGSDGFITWNKEAGTVTGDRADAVLRTAEHARKEGSIGFTPLGLYSEADPLKDDEAFAILLLYMNYKPPKILRDAITYPPPYDGNVPVVF